MSNYISFKKGNFPIILSCPHDGDLKLDIEPRIDNGKNILSNDSNMSGITNEIYKGIIDIIETKKKPFYIKNNIHRKYIDVNRDINNGTEHNLTREIWRVYHHKLKEYINICKKKFGHCLLIDLHGNDKTFDIIQLGYGISLGNIGENIYNNCSLSFLNNFYNIKELIIGDRCIGNLIKNIDTTPSSLIYNREHMENIAYDNLYYKGGYIIKSTSKKYNIDSIQIEISSDLRRKPFLKKISKNLSNAIMEFYFKNYIPILTKI